MLPRKKLRASGGVRKKAFKTPLSCCGFGPLVGDHLLKFVDLFRGHHPIHPSPVPMIPSIRGNAFFFMGMAAMRLIMIA